MRDPLDRYYTSPELAVACLQRLVSRAQVQPAIVYDAHCGRREWLSAARLVMPKVEVAGADLDVIFKRTAAASTPLNGRT